MGAERSPLCGRLLATGGREVDSERRPLTGRTVHEHQAAVRFHRALHDGESETGATHPGGGKWLEQPLLQLIGNSWTVVRDPQGNRIVDPRAAGQLVGGRAAGPDGDPDAGAPPLNGLEPEV